MSDLFQGCKFWFPNGGIPKAQSSILKSQISRLGGEIVDSVDEASFAVVLNKDIGFTFPFKCQVVSPDWVSQSILHGTLLKTSSTKSKDEVVHTQKRVDSIQKDSPEHTSLGSRTVNESIAGEFEKLGSLYKDLGDQWRNKTYNRAAGILRSLSFPIKDEKDIKKLEMLHLNGIGPKVLEKIHDYVIHGKLERLESLYSQEDVAAIETFSQIHGVGPILARKWYSKGYRTLKDIEKISESLTKPQAIGLKYYNELIERIPRHEVEKLFEVVKNTATEITNGLECICGGSYRRGNSSCGDIDILITPALGHENIDLSDFLTKLLTKLHSLDFITDDLTTIDSSKSFMGICRLSNESPHRRIDIKVYPREAFPFACLYFTGNDQFNRGMRKHAKNLGYSLTDRCLARVLRTDYGKIKLGELILCKSEKDVFNILHLKYVPPTERQRFDSDTLSIG